MIVPTLSALLLVGQLVSAMPFAQVTRNLPRDVIHVALDEKNGQYRAYRRDGSLYGTYSADLTRDVKEHKRDNTGGCAPLAIDEAKQLTGFKLIEQYADKTWGTGSRNEVTNPTEADQVGSGATACVSGDVVQVQLTGSPTCNSNTGQTGATTSGTNGTITSGVMQGYSNTADWSVTSSSSIGVSVQVSAEFEIPEIATIGAQVTTTATFTSTTASGFSTTATGNVNNAGTFNVPTNKTCTINYDVTTCDVTGEGQVRYVAAGWIWFQYDDQVQGHYKWAVSIEAVITNLDDRSSFMQFTGNIQGNTKANFTTSCV